jgi:hypothetical protein
MESGRRPNRAGIFCLRIVLIFLSLVSSSTVTMEVAVLPEMSVVGRLRLKCDGTRAEITFRLSAKRTSLFKSARLITDTRGVRMSGNNAGYTMFRGSVKSIGYPLHSPVSPSLTLPCVTVCLHISTGL